MTTKLTEVGIGAVTDVVKTHVEDGTVRIVVPYSVKVVVADAVMVWTACTVTVFRRGVVVADGAESASLFCTVAPDEAMVYAVTVAVEETPQA